MLEKINLNKLNDREVSAVKKYMDQNFLKNKLNPGDPGFRYEIERDFNPDESNDWDKSQSGASIGRKPSSRTREGLGLKSATLQPPKHPQQQAPQQSNKGIVADEEFDIDFDEDFNDDLDDFED